MRDKIRKSNAKTDTNVIPANGNAIEIAAPTKTAPCHNGILLGAGGAPIRPARLGRRFHHRTKLLMLRNKTARQNTVFAKTLHKPNNPMCSAMPKAIALPAHE